MSRAIAETEPRERLKSSYNQHSNQVGLDVEGHHVTNSEVDGRLGELVAIAAGKEHRSTKFKRGEV